MKESENTNLKISLKELLEKVIENDLKLELEEIKENMKGQSEEKIKQQQEIALIKMAALKKTNHNIGFDKLIMILNDITARAGYGTIKSLTIDKYTYER